MLGTAGAGSVKDAPGLGWRAVAAMFSRSHAGFNSVQSLNLSSWQGLHVFSPAHCCRLSQVAQAPMLSRCLVVKFRATEGAGALCGY